MAIIEWNNTFATNIKEIDEQHKILFDNLNKLNESIESDNSVEASAAVLNELYEYTIYHFNTEEEMLIYKKYPKLTEHKKQHEDFTYRILQFKSEFRRENIIDAKDFLEFLSTWLKNHTTTLDIEYAEYINKK